MLEKETAGVTKDIQLTWSDFRLVLVVDIKEVICTGGDNFGIKFCNYL